MGFFAIQAYFVLQRTYKVYFLTKDDKGQVIIQNDILCLDKIAYLPGHDFKIKLLKSTCFKIN